MRRIIPTFVEPIQVNQIEPPLDEKTALERQTQLLPVPLILKLNKGQVTESDLYEVVFHLNQINALDRYWTVKDLVEYTGLSGRFEYVKGIKSIINRLDTPVPRFGKRCPAGMRYNKQDELCYSHKSKSRRRRCPNGTRYNKSRGKCIQKRKSKSKSRRRRCPNGTRYNKSRGKCISKSRRKRSK